MRIRHIGPTSLQFGYFNFQMEQLTSSENKLELKEEMVQALQTDVVVSYVLKATIICGYNF
jgi:hypothetical protein